MSAWHVAGLDDVGVGRSSREPELVVHVVRARGKSVGEVDIDEGLKSRVEIGYGCAEDDGESNTIERLVAGCSCDIKDAVLGSELRVVRHDREDLSSGGSTLRAANRGDVLDRHRTI